MLHSNLDLALACLIFGPLLASFHATFWLLSLFGYFFVEYWHKFGFGFFNFWPSLAYLHDGHFYFWPSLATFHVEF
jgi:hypothetical protein